MIVFHEGMPGSGKSYAAMRDHIIPALQKGRKVFARMNGLDRDKIAAVSGVDRERLEELLYEIAEEEVVTLCQVKDGQWQLPADCLLVIDELQNFYPQKRPPLDPETTKFVAEHRHRGMDILAMGQLLKDCHRTWVNRTNRKFQFLNKDVVGKADEYKWRLFNGQPDSKGAVIFNEVTGGSLPYDKSIFGTYKSFQDETQNTERLTDDRVNIFNSKAFKVYLPLLGLVALGGLGYLGYLFSGGLAKAETKKPEPVAVRTVFEETGKQPIVIDNGVKEKIVVKEKAQQEDDWPDYLTEIIKDNRARLAYAIRTPSHTRIVLEVRDKSNQIIESFNSEQLHELGWSVMVSDSLKMVSINKGEKRYLVTAWPIPEPLAKTSNVLEDQIREESKNFVRSSPGRSFSGAKATPGDTGA